MDNPRGRVLSVSPTGDNVRAIVAVSDMPACARCAAGKGCGAGLFATATGARQIEAVVSNGMQPRVGDEVELRISPHNLLRASFLVYGLPLLGAIAGAAIAYALSLGDAISAALAIVGVSGGLLVSRRRLERSSCIQRYTPTIERLC